MKEETKRRLPGVIGIFACGMVFMYMIISISCDFGKCFC